MSHTLLLTDDLIIKGRILEWTTGIEIPGKSEVIELDITIRVNSKLKNFIVSFYLDK